MEKILLAFDGGPAARKALATTAELARLSGAAVTVLGVVPPPPSATEWPVALSDWDCSDEFAATLEEASAYLVERGIETEVEELEGEPAPVIERLADDGGFDTIVVGSRGLGPLRRFLEGSVSGHVATHARETVLVVHWDARRGPNSEPDARGRSGWPAATSRQGPRWS